MKTMTYKGYAARIEYSDEDGCFVGHVAGINDIVGFHGESVVKLCAAFKEAVDDYLDTCEKLNRPPQKPYSGKLRAGSTSDFFALYYGFLGNLMRHRMRLTLHIRYFEKTLVFSF